MRKIRTETYMGRGARNARLSSGSYKTGAVASIRPLAMDPDITS